MNADTLISPMPVSFGGHVFVCGAVQTPEGLYQPVVIRRASDKPQGMTQLPPDAEPYGSVKEALRHAEQQALRWVNDRTGDGRETC